MNAFNVKAKVKGIIGHVPREIRCIFIPKSAFRLAQYVEMHLVIHTYLLILFQQPRAHIK